MQQFKTTIIVLLIFTVSIQAQIRENAPFKDLEIYYDTLNASYFKSGVYYKGKYLIPLFYDKEEVVCELNIIPKDNKRVQISPLGDYIILDSMVLVEDVLKTRIQFRDLTENNFQKIRLVIGQDSIQQKYFDIGILPYTYTEVEIQNFSEDLYIGEEKIFRLISNNPNNIRIPTEWEHNNDIDYKLTRENGQLRLHLLPNKIGNQNFRLPLSTFTPYINDKGKIIYNYPILDYKFKVKGSRLQFLTIDRKDITLDEQNQREGIEVQLEDNWRIVIGKTYRVEDQEEKGGPLIAEIYTKTRLDNGKVLCLLRPYSYHRNFEGYLYMKDADIPKFISNFNVTPKTQIKKISLLRDGKNWTESLNVRPGETIHLKIEGEGLHKANFHVEDINDISSDSLMRSENVAEYKFSIPLNITKKQINIYNHGKPTGYLLDVKEYQDSREFDFVDIDYGDRKVKFSTIRGPRLYFNTVKDVSLSFSNYKLDSETKLDGKQYLDLEIEVTDKNNKFIETKEIKDITVCPSNNSPRYKYYDVSDCTTKDINLNDYLRTKTYDLEEWSRIKLTLEHDNGKHSNGYNKEIELILARRYKFDIDVSFPAGLITIYKTDKENDDGTTKRVTETGNLWGISMAMIGQFSFYHPDKIAKLRPYKIGAGFIALNAFNFSSNASNQDIALVILGSLYPTSKDKKLAFPLYLGGGYKIKDNSIMFLVGPGIRVTL